MKIRIAVLAACAATTIILTASTGAFAKEKTNLVPNKSKGAAVSICCVDVAVSNTDNDSAGRALKSQKTGKNKTGQRLPSSKAKKQPAPAATLLLPYFEVDMKNQSTSSGKTQTPRGSK